jgi:hypothetical protein
MSQIDLDNSRQMKSIDPLDNRPAITRASIDLAPLAFGIMPRDCIPNILAPLELAPLADIPPNHFDSLSHDVAATAHRAASNRSHTGPDT